MAAEKHTGFEAVGAPIILGAGSLVERHLRIDAKRFWNPPASFPGASFEGLFRTLDFDKNTEESVYCFGFVPLRWKPASDITIVINWLHDSVDNGVVVWGIEYKSIKTGETIAGAGTIITQNSAGTHTAGQLISTTFTTKILGSNLEEDDIIGIRLFRKAADGSDTLNEDARFVSMHTYFTQDKLGKSI